MTEPDDTSRQPTIPDEAHSRTAQRPLDVDSSLLEVTEANSWALMEAQRQSDEVERSMRIGDCDTAEKAVEILHGLWLGAAAYESPAGPTPAAILEMTENARRMLYGQPPVFD